LYGYVLVAPRAHVEHVVRDLDRQGNAHIHWHIAPLASGTPYERQQFHALMAENGVIPWSDRQAADLADRLRAALAENVPPPV
jgi:histidine triad (HIT) family protein